MVDEKEEKKEEEKTEKTKELPVAPVVEQQLPPMLLSERDARSLLFELYDLAQAARGAFNMPATSSINRSPNFYLNELIRTLKEYNIIE